MLAPSAVIPPNPFSCGRRTNRKLWVDHIIDSIDAMLMEYAMRSLVDQH